MLKKEFNKIISHFRNSDRVPTIFIKFKPQSFKDFGTIFYGRPKKVIIVKHIL